MPQTSIDWYYLLWLFCHPSYILDAVGTGEGLIQMVDTDTADGLRLIFSTNLFGHFLLVRKLEDLLCDSSCHIIWTSSSNARRKYLDLEDIQHKKGTQPYSSSKFGMNILSIALNDRLQDKGAHSHVISPGFALTGMTSPILQKWFWFLLFPFLILMRLMIPTMCLTAWNSAEALVWLFQSNPKEVSPSHLYTSSTSVFGHNHVIAKKIDCKTHEPMLLYQKLDELQRELERTRKQSME
ncbi:3-keto-steroid reductase [Holothuria leucospilota]|uniref:3-keto-steroid reductase n=1 Tax=Holothuria leucospilota TaxID=206669 RepID=A0A9Q1C5S3_HOLLE|nr:3-keto-steroid reductase [Holothuria leucospilota]